MKFLTTCLEWIAWPFQALHDYLNRDRTSGSVGTIHRTPEEMAAWRELPDPKPSYRKFVGLPEEREP